MFLYILFKYAVLFSPLFAVSANGNEVKNESSTAVVDAEIVDYTDEIIEFRKSCSEANLKMLAYSDSIMNKIVVSFEIVPSDFINCFTYFDIFLKKNQSDVDAAKVPFNSDEDKQVSYNFENVTCGLYEVVIQPCFNDEDCAPVHIKYPKIINKTGIHCIGLHPTPLSWKMQKIQSQGIERKVLLITTVVAITLLLVIGFVHMLANRKLSKKKKPLIEEEIGETQNRKAIAKDVEVFIINHYNNTTIRKVELLKDFLSHCPNLNVILIEDGLAVNLITGSEWLNSMLTKDENYTVVKKLIIVDSVEEMEAEENENENITFYEAIRKISCDWSRSLDDYDNLFVVHFNSSFTKLKELDYIVKRVRYCIPVHLITLCLNLMSGTQFDAHGIEEKLTHLLCKHDIKNLGTCNV